MTMRPEVWVHQLADFLGLAPAQRAAFLAFVPAQEALKRGRATMGPDLGAHTAYVRPGAYLTHLKPATIAALTVAIRDRYPAIAALSGYF
mmetsp:Transcript_3932/g.11616  ORF Transcript_3932/g.11616 Transcript_3932/m.11616 type:complete len:90 (+) Transcript_3932:794-1063(+)